MIIRWIETMKDEVNNTTPRPSSRVGERSPGCAANLAIL